MVNSGAAQDEFDGVNVKDVVQSAEAVNVVYIVN